MSEREYPESSKRAEGITSAYQLRNDYYLRVPKNKEETIQLLTAAEFLTRMEVARDAILEAALLYTGWGWDNMTPSQRKAFLKLVLPK